MKYGLIGHPVGHSYSKIIHAMLGNDAYEIVDVSGEQLETFLRKREYEGLNVTLPYKQDVMTYLDEVDPFALKIGAVNTIINQHGRLKGYNTDYYGFRALVLRHMAPEDIAGKKVLILGTGGTSKTVAKVFEDFGVTQIYKVSRNPLGTDAVSMSEAVKLQAEIVVNTTPLGMYPEDEVHCLNKEYREDIYSYAQLCLDVVYRPTETAFVREAIKRGIRAEGGLYMLVGQAVYAARLFMECDFSEEKIEEVFDKMKEYLQEEAHICVQGKLQVPPSKSYSHRHLIMAALNKGNSVIRDVGKSQDVEVTIEGLRSLGAIITVLNEDEIKQTLRIDGTDFLSAKVREDIYCRESGSSLRFLLPLALLQEGCVKFTGEAGLMRRPMEVYEQMCKEQGIFYKKDSEGITVCGLLQAGDYKIPANISSQFVSGLLFVLPFLKKDSTIELIPPVESLPYIDMTLAVLKQWGIEAERKDNRIFVSGNQQTRGGEYIVEKDYSNAAYLAAYRYVGHDVEICGLDGETLQGDCVYGEVFERLANEQHPTIEMQQTPDLVPIAMAVAAYFSGAKFTGTKRLAFKESNRGEAMAEELKKFGVECTIGKDWIEVVQSRIQRPQEPLWGHNDHRIVMALSVLLSVTGGTIDGYEAVNKSFPTYFSQLKKCGLWILDKIDGK